MNLRGAELVLPELDIDECTIAKKRGGGARRGGL